jgi:hypothetical protein
VSAAWQTLCIAYSSLVKTHGEIAVQLQVPHGERLVSEQIQAIPVLQIPGVITAPADQLKGNYLIDSLLLSQGVTVAQVSESVFVPVRPFEIFPSLSRQLSAP